jgi:hypothetical protein
MSTPTHAGRHGRASTVAIPPPRPSAEPRSEPASERPSGEARGPVEPAGGPRPGMFERHAWLIPAVGIASVIAVFVSMIVLTWVAGGGTPFDR